MSELSEGELQAERIFFAAISRKYTHKEAVLAAKWLEWESPIGAQYLRWLLARGNAWPKVKGNYYDGPKKATREVLVLETALEWCLPKDAGR